MFFFRYKRLKEEENLQKRAEKQQNPYEMECEKRKELYDIAIVLEKSDFLNILYKYKMQKITLTKTKDLLSIKCGLSESDILLILENL